MSKNYRSYVQGVVSQANRQAAFVKSNLVYTVLTQWLRHEKIRLDNEMFKAVLNTCNKLKDEYISCGTASIKESSEFMSMFFHTFTGEDELHTDPELLMKYVKPVFAIIKQRIDDEKDSGSYVDRLRKVDVVRIGKLFDEILARVKDKDKKNEIKQMMNDFCINDLE